MKNKFGKKSIYPFFYGLLFVTCLCRVYAASDIVAKVGGEIITRAELLSEMSSSIHATDTIGGDLKSAKQNVLNNMIELKILLLEATAEKITVDSKTVELSYQYETTAAGSEDKFKKKLKLMGETDKQFRQNLTNSIKIQTMLRLNVDAHLKPISLEEAENFYQEHKSEFTTGEQVRFRYIYISTTRETTAEDKSKKLIKAQKALELIKAGEAFPKIVQDYSEGNATGFGGDIGRYVRPGELYNLPEVEKAVFSMDSGKTSNLIPTKYGYYIVQIIDKEKGHLRSFEQVKTEILEKLEKEKAESRYYEWFNGIKTKYAIELYTENL